jgi:hypothetical protein
LDGKAFDQVARRLATSFSRRGLWGIATGTALGAVVARLPLAADAKKRKRRNKGKRKPGLQRNGFGCVDIGKPCRGNNANCCSGICDGEKPKKGKKDTSRCVAHNVGECQADQDVCRGIGAACGDGGACFRTTGNASFCGDGGQCVACQKDADCEAMGFLAGAACVDCAEDCQDISGGTACFRAGA